MTSIHILVCQLCLVTSGLDVSMTTMFYQDVFPKFGVFSIIFGFNDIFGFSEEFLPKSLQVSYPYIFRCFRINCDIFEKYDVILA